MPRAPRTPRDGRVTKSDSRQTPKRNRYDFTLNEDRQVLLGLLSLVHFQNPDMKELHRILGNNAYSVGTLKKRLLYLKKMSKELRDDRQERIEWETHANESNEYEDGSESEGSESFDEAPTPPQTSDVSMSPETPLHPRYHRESSPIQRRNDRRGRARNTGSDTRRAESMHASRRQPLRDTYRPSRDSDERPRGGREDLLPRQPLRGRREGPRSSRDHGRNRSPNPGSAAFQVQIHDLTHH